MATTPRTEPPAAARSGPSAEPLPDFEGVDVAGLAARTDHAVLGEVAALLLRNWPSGEDAVAYYEDGPGKLLH
ncbi:MULTISPECIES: YxD-tail cyclophane-containing RiPP peptide [unclassified Streptomyces]|uniref:YxD-tail cyclophane-containing RiPP peptide n=1 Tax=unclassified Streptomyces TaxID=2593676 RepID=UPI0037F761AD